MKIGDEVLIHGYVDEIRKDVVIIRNEGGYFGTAKSEVTKLIKHGYWHILNDTDMTAVCSICGNDTMLYYGSVVTDFEYCPCCGAKMDMLKRKRTKKDEEKDYIF